MTTAIPTLPPELHGLGITFCEFEAPVGPIADIDDEELRACAEEYAGFSGADLQDILMSSEWQEARDAYGLSFMQWQYAAACAYAAHVRRAAQLVHEAEQASVASVAEDVFLVNRQRLQETRELWFGNDVPAVLEQAEAPYWLVSQAGDLSGIRNATDLLSFTLAS